MPAHDFLLAFVYVLFGSIWQSALLLFSSFHISSIQEMNDCLESTSNQIGICFQHVCVRIDNGFAIFMWEIGT